MQTKSSNLDKIKTQIRHKLEFTNIFKETILMANMNRHLEIDLKHFKKMKIFQQLTEQQILQILTSLPFIKYQNLQSNTQNRKLIKLSYNLSSTLLLVTGIHEQPLSTLLKYYYQYQQKHSNSEKQKIAPSRILSNNGFFMMIETHTVQNANNLRRYLRSKKNNFDHKAYSSYKMENRKVRITSLVEEDLFTFLIDIMTQFKEDHFMKSFSLQNNRYQKSQQTINISKKTIIYRPFSIQAIQSSFKIIEQFQDNERFSENKISQQSIKIKSIKEEDESSQSTSFNSELMDLNLQDSSDEEANKYIQNRQLGRQYEVE